MKKYICWAVLVVLVVGGYFIYPNINKEAEIGNDPIIEKPAPQPSTGGENTSKESDGFTLISGITNSMVGQDVKIAGYVTSISGGKGHTFCTVKDPNSGASIKVVLFKSDSEADPSRKNNLKASYNNKAIITIEGKVDVYEEELEVIAKKVY